MGNDIKTQEQESPNTEESENSSILVFLKENKWKLALAGTAVIIGGTGTMIWRKDEEELYDDSPAVTTDSVSLVVDDVFSGYTIGNVKQAVWSFFKAEGFPEESIAGIMGNIEVESGFDPDRVQIGTPKPYIYKVDDGIGYGLIQVSEQSRKERLLNDFAIPVNYPRPKGRG